MIINITNGDYYNSYFENKTGEKGISFSEAMMMGSTDDVIFSSRFISLRCDSLHTTTREYEAKMKNVIDLKNFIKDIKEVNLYFGLDTFCQLNLLTSLAYLEQISYNGKVFLNIINDYTYETIKSNINVTLGIYDNLYKETLISKRKLDNTGIIDSHAIDLYFDYLSNSGYLSKLVKENISAPDDKLLKILLDNSKEYGLSDLMALQLINKERNKNYMNITFNTTFITKYHFEEGSNYNHLNVKYDDYIFLVIDEVKKNYKVKTIKSNDTVVKEFNKSYIYMIKKVKKDVLLDVTLKGSFNLLVVNKLDEKLNEEYNLEYLEPIQIIIDDYINGFILSKITITDYDGNKINIKDLELSSYKKSLRHYIDLKMPMKDVLITLDYIKDNNNLLILDEDNNSLLSSDEYKDLFSNLLDK